MPYSNEEQAYRACYDNISREQEGGLSKLNMLTYSMQMGKYRVEILAVVYYG
jgi:hypothetical protein